MKRSPLLGVVEYRTARAYQNGHGAPPAMSVPDPQMESKCGLRELVYGKH